jgi:hypothetical protein
MTALMGAGGAEGVESMIQKLEQLKGLIDQVLPRMLRLLY